MRIIGTIEHPTLRISVFRYENKTSVKLENQSGDITFKLGDDERFQQVEGVRQLLDPLFLEAIQAQLKSMHQQRLAAMSRQFAAGDVDDFEVII
jgi:hypothetical protein